LGAPRQRTSRQTGSDAGAAAGCPVDGLSLGAAAAARSLIRFDANDYSVHPTVIGRRIEVIAGLDRFQAFCDGRLVADHPRCWARHQSVRDPEHLEAIPGHEPSSRRSSCVA
jgi:hypothetical protein